MTRTVRVALVLACLSLLRAAPASAQVPPDDRRLWILVGGAFMTMHGDCTTCEQEYPYRHSAALVTDIGFRVTERMTVAAEVFWMPVAADGIDQIQTTHLDGVAQFRPWSSKGFFVKGGAGMAFVRNWVDVEHSPPIRSKALSVVVGAGWDFQPWPRVGLQLFATQHAGALGDLQTSLGVLQDVMGNFWSIGAALTFR